MTAFDLNEDLKKCCVLLGAETAVTIYFKEGVPIIPEPFYETHIIFPKEFDVDNVTETLEAIKFYVGKLTKNEFECTDLSVEIKKGILKIIYSIFADEASFMNSELNYVGD